MIVRLIVLVLCVLCVAVVGVSAQTAVSFDTPVGNAAWNGIVNREVTFSIVGDRAITLVQGGGLTIGDLGASDWGLTRNFSGALQLTGLRFEGASTLLIGPLDGDARARANSWFGGRKLNDKFIDEDATFSLKVPCLEDLETENHHPFVFHPKKEHADNDWDDDDDDDGGGGVVVPGSPAVTPEPATMLLLGSGFAVVLGAIRRRKSTSAA
jgi:hypothetical protein